MDSTDIDRKGLIRESYQIEGIGPEECRSIFLDWALSLPDGADMRAVITRMLAQYEHANPDHPMTAVLRDGLIAAPKPTRRGGWRGARRLSS
ncbi:hypothetical protein [Oceaniglobus ichthyenteri]|uniref:hypothetical protein n=1 Tax=Oceaniglobus ichthyenteri TaxID=2136177 RepID=UPI000D33B908|nr:hypothetical protein [Oceaniglobus ichthyenteri]